ncbi:hypothetical protein VTI74DRAFT_10663 [Chaetomium olivicolor]
MRKGSADNIYVIPAPYVFSFGAATLVAAACCVPGILSIISTWDKILRTNFAKQFGGPPPEEVIEGTNGATVGLMKTVNGVIRRLLSVIEVPVFGGAVLALIIVGELNFWSGPVRYQTETMANVGQWGPILASVLAACGSLYLLLAKNIETVEKGGDMVHLATSCICPCHENPGSRPDSLTDGADPEMQHLPRSATDPNAQVCRRDTSPTHLTAVRTDTAPDDETLAQGLGIHTTDSRSSTAGHSRREVTKRLIKLANALGTASPDLFDDSEFRHGKATSFPEIPGESHRNSKLNQIKEQWGHSDLDVDDTVTPRGRRSRANSFNGVISRSNSAARATSPQRPQTPQPSTPPSKTQPAASGSLLGLPTSASPESISEPMFPARPSADLDKTKSQGIVVTLHEGPNSPAIVLSSEDEPEETEGPSLVTSPPIERRPP